MSISVCINYVNTFQIPWQWQIIPVGTRHWNNVDSTSDKQRGILVAYESCINVEISTLLQHHQISVYSHFLDGFGSISAFMWRWIKITYPHLEINIQCWNNVEIWLQRDVTKFQHWQVQRQRVGKQLLHVIQR